MKKLLSILLIVSTLFLSVGFQTCFAKPNYGSYFSEQNCEKNQKDIEIQKLKELLKQAEIRNEQLENEKKDAKVKKLNKLLKEAETRINQLENENKKKDNKNNSSSLWSRIKSKFSFFFSSYVGIGIAAVSFGAILVAFLATAMAGLDCYKDKDCKFWNSAEGHNFWNKFKTVDYSKVLECVGKIIDAIMKNTHVVGVENTNN